MYILDWITSILRNGKKNAKFYTKPLKKNIGDPTPLEIGLYDGETPITNEEIGIEINTQKYIKTTDENGIATLNINLGVGEYTAKIYWRGNNDYNNITAYAEVIISTDTYMDGINLTKNQGESTPYQCSLYRSDNGGRIKDKINITINGVTYTREADNDGLYKLNINLSEGRYNIKAEFNGTELFNPSIIENTITINKAPAPEPEPEPEPPIQLWDYITDTGGGQLGQRTGYTCGPHSLMQCIYRLTGIELSEMELAGICGTTTDGTDHDGLETGLAWFNREYGYNLKMEWKNFSEVGFEGTQEVINNGACFHHILYRNQWGHYEVPKWTDDDPIYVLNSLGDSCGDGYCGYIEERSRDEHQSYINGINQKSVCIITRG